MTSTCPCRRPPFQFSDFCRTGIGTDDAGGEVAIERCVHCGTTWLSYLIEEPHYSRSGRWWRVEAPAEAVTGLSARDAKAMIEDGGSGFVGGSFFDSTGHAVAAPIRIR